MDLFYCFLVIGSFALPWPMLYMSRFCKKNYTPKSSGLGDKSSSQWRGAHTHMGVVDLRREEGIYQSSLELRKTQHGVQRLQTRILLFSPSTLYALTGILGATEREQFSLQMWKSCCPRGSLYLYKYSKRSCGFYFSCPTYSAPSWPQQVWTAGKDHHNQFESLSFFLSTAPEVYTCWLWFWSCWGPGVVCLLWGTWMTCSQGAISSEADIKCSLDSICSRKIPLGAELSEVSLDSDTTSGVVPLWSYVESLRSFESPLIWACMRVLQEGGRCLYFSSLCPVALQSSSVQNQGSGCLSIHYSLLGSSAYLSGLWSYG